MLQTVHRSREIRPRPLSSHVKRPRSHERVFKALEPVYEVQPVSDTHSVGSLGDAGEPELHRMAERYSDMRDELAYRKLRGDELSAREHLLLLVLNKITQLVMRPQDPISEEVLDAAAEVRRLRAKHRR